MTKRVLVMAALAWAVGATTSVAAQGIPVYDATAVLKALEQLKAWQKQYLQMKEQIDLQKEHLQKLTGTRNLGAILDNVSTEATVPTSIAQQWRELTSHEQVVAAALQATSQALGASTQRADQVRALMQAINSTQDPKAIAELHARIQAEVALVNNDVQRVQLLQIQREVQQRRIDEEQRDKIRRDRAKPLATW